MYHRPRASRRGSYKDYFLPFFLIVVLGVVVVLIFNLFRALFSADPVRAAYMHIVEGSVQMKAWGTEGFFDLNSDALIMQGDEIYTASGSKVIVEFFDGTMVRVGGGTNVLFDSIAEDGENSQVSLKLLTGALWVNREYKGTENSEMLVEMGHVRVDSEKSGIFEVESGVDDLVRVLSVFDNTGARVDILSQDKAKVVESENVGVGQEILFSKAVLDRYWAYQSPTVISAFDEAFRTGDWYEWNIAEDKAPTKFEKIAGAESAGLVKVEPEVLVQEEPVPEESGLALEDSSASSEELVPESSVNSESSAVDAVVTGSLTKPTVSSVAGAQADAAGVFHVSSRVATLTGTVSGADKVLVNGYVLQKYKPGDTSWTYFANADFALMKPGENSYQVYSLDSTGKKSEVLIIKVVYTPPEEGASNDSTSPSGTSTTLPEDSQPVQPLENTQSAVED